MVLVACDMIDWNTNAHTPIPNFAIITPATPDSNEVRRLRLAMTLNFVSAVSFGNCTSENAWSMTMTDCTRRMSHNMGVLKKSATQGAMAKIMP